MICVIVKGEVNVPDDALCYVRITDTHCDFHRDIAWKLEDQYFYWYGSDKEYRIVNNIHFNKFYPYN